MGDVCLVLIKPKGDAPDPIEARRQILKWDKARPGPNGARELLSRGMLCEIDEEDLDEARALGEVEVLGTKPAEEEPHA